MDPTLEFQSAPGALALDEEDDFLVAADARRAGVHDLDLPALTLGVLRVHPQQVAGEEARLVTSGACADLDEDVLVVVGIARQEQALEIALECRLAGRELIDLELGQLGQLAVAAVGQEVARLAATAQDFAVLTEALDDLAAARSEEHTSELQSPYEPVC